MTEQEWLACKDWFLLVLEAKKRLRIVQRKAARHKLRLLACACCREWILLVRSESRDALEVAERLPSDLLAGSGV